MPWTLDEASIARNEIDVERARAYLDFVQRLIEAGLDLSPRYGIHRPLDERFDARTNPVASQHQIVHSQQ